MKKFIIHFLGGVTEEELNKRLLSVAHSTEYVTLTCMMKVMERNHGKSFDEWSKAIYDHVEHNLHALENGD